MVNFDVCESIESRRRGISHPTAGAISVAGLRRVSQADPGGSNDVRGNSLQFGLCIVLPVGPSAGHPLMGLLAGTRFDRPPHCERCEKPESECSCPPLEPEPFRVAPEKQTARLVVEKRKHGRTMTVIRGLAATENDLASLLTRLKNSCGAGGTITDDALEIQGSHLDRVRTELQEIGYKVRG